MGAKRKAKTSQKNFNNNNVVELNSFTKKKQSVTILPRNKNQEQYVLKLLEPTKDIVFGIGPAGTGKTLLAVQVAVKLFKEGKVDKITEELNTQLETDLTEAVESKVSEMVENLDAYLDYVVSEWMEENEVAIEAGIKVEMAESLMDGLKELFGEHNIKVDEETYDIVSDLEEEMTSLEEKSNAVVNENIRLSKDIAELRAGVVFEEMTSELNMSQRERLKTLSENLDSNDLDTYTDNLKTIKESFFKETNVSPKEDVVDEEDEVMIEEETVTKPVSDHSSINALVEALNSRKT